MDLSQIAISQTAFRNQFTYDQSEQDLIILRAEHRRRRLQTLWLGKLGALKPCSGVVQRFLRGFAPMAARPHVAK